MNIDERELYQKVVHKFGTDHQILVAVEELAELITALMQFNNRGKVPLSSVIEEVADVSIMIDQLSLMIGLNAVDAKKKEKLERLAGLL